MPENEPLQKSAIQSWLAAIGKDRQWLAEKLIVSVGSVNQWLSAKGVFPADRQESVRLLMEAESTPLIGDPEGNLVSFTLDEFERIEASRLRLNYETRPPMYRDAILAFIEADEAAQRKILPLSSSPSLPVSQPSIAAEDTQAPPVTETRLPVIYPTPKRPRKS